MDGEKNKDNEKETIYSFYHIHTAHVLTFEEHNSLASTAANTFLDFLLASPDTHPPALPLALCPLLFWWNRIYCHQLNEKWFVWRAFAAQMTWQHMLFIARRLSTWLETFAPCSNFGLAVSRTRAACSLYRGNYSKHTHKLETMSDNQIMHLMTQLTGICHSRVAAHSRGGSKSDFIFYHKIDILCHGKYQLVS